MTWKEFVEEVERQLKEMGLSHDVEIDWMDFSYPDMSCSDSAIEVAGNESGIAIH